MIAHFRALARFDIVRASMTAILLVAAGFKAHHLLLTNEIEASATLFSSPWFMLATIEFELLLALWLISGVYLDTALAACFASFCAFQCVAFAEGLLGRQSCGCFGTARVSPWSMFLVDLIAVGALGWRITRGTDCFRGQTWGLRSRRPIIAMLAISIANGAWFAFLVTNSDPRSVERETGHPMMTRLDRARRDIPSYFFSNTRSASLIEHEKLAPW
ncbi:MAG: hypothetical protein KF708_11710 [Pirellulales bacterium]|nr:hypothetical protein [Pirellulales bacterium]